MVKAKRDEIDDRTFSRSRGGRFAMGFAWFSLGLLITEAAAPGTLNRLFQIGKSGSSHRLRKLRRRSNSVHVKKAFTINRQPDVVYGFWRRLENLSRFMRHLESVEVIDEQRSHWRAKAPAGLTVEWDAEIVDDQPNERLSWRSLEGATVPNRGTVRFAPAPGARGTELHVELEYWVPGGRVTATLAKLFGEEPEQQIHDDLRRLKQLLEAGEIAVSEGSSRLRQPAQPVPALYSKRIASEGVRP